MATLDLQEQEQLDNLKAFWSKWGNWVTGLATLVLLAVAAWNGWTWYLRDQGLKASALFESVEQAVAAKESDKAARLLAEMQTRFARSAYTGQASLLVAQAAAKPEVAAAALQWAANQAEPSDLRDLARLRLAGLQLDAKQWDAAAQTLNGVVSEAFAALVADRRGDLAQLRDDPASARKHYEAAYLGLTDDQPYKRVLEAKLMALGADPASLKKGAP